MSDNARSRVKWKNWQSGKDGLVAEAIGALWSRTKWICDGGVLNARLRTGYLTEDKSTWIEVVNDQNPVIIDPTDWAQLSRPIAKLESAEFQINSEGHLLVRGILIRDIHSGNYQALEHPDGLDMPCGRHFEPKDLVFACLYCQNDSKTSTTYILCQNCFEPSDHADHMKYVEINTNESSSSECDCGKKVWRERLHCRMHKQERQLEGVSKEKTKKIPDQSIVLITPDGSTHNAVMIFDSSKSGNQISTTMIQKIRAQRFLSVDDAPFNSISTAKNKTAIRLDWKTDSDSQVYRHTQFHVFESEEHLVILGMNDMIELRFYKFQGDGKNRQHVYHEKHLSAKEQEKITTKELKQLKMSETSRRNKEEDEKKQDETPRAYETPRVQQGRHRRYS